MEDLVAGPRRVIEYNLSHSSKKTNATISTTRPTTSPDLWKRVAKYISNDPHPTTVTLPVGLGKQGWVQRDRATACCVSISSQYFRDLLPTTTTKEMETNGNAEKNWWQGTDGYVLVGVSHIKSGNRVRMKHNKKGFFHYLSRLYAFSPHPPYQVVARSGLFCLETGMYNKSEGHDPYVAAFQRNKTNPRVNLGRWFEFRGKTYNCPRIHFVSGMSESAVDPSRMVLAYGVSDCYSRMIEIRKRDFCERMFVAPDQS
uniref:Uncharacterized protein n=1 Tax=Proboscia inermis TaxID=420281 RepID=A0A7S0GG54_9STRA|mmetsp:Transcript_30983/g.31263  ORF Transcript_30983/g.31263 Transcript_30983/m.31263 type:complete len:257 (+) Transcript_30983:157-927(+)